MCTASVARVWYHAGQTCYDQSRSTSLARGRYAEVGLIPFMAELLLKPRASPAQTEGPEVSSYLVYCLTRVILGIRAVSAIASASASLMAGSAASVSLMPVRRIACSASSIVSYSAIAESVESGGP